MRNKEFILYDFLGKADYSEWSETELGVHNENWGLAISLHYKCM